VRRGESDREAVRAMRVVHDGHALGLFVEGTRQKNGCPVRRCPAQRWSRSRRTSRCAGGVYGGQFCAGQLPSSLDRLGEPMRFEGIPRSGKGYEGSALIRTRSTGSGVGSAAFTRTAARTAPRRTVSTDGSSARSQWSAFERRQIDTRQPADRLARRRPRDARRDTRPEGGRLRWAGQRFLPSIRAGASSTRRRSRSRSPSRRRDARPTSSLSSTRGRITPGTRSSPRSSATRASRSS
jgi:hypothetical protein